MGESINRGALPGRTVPSGAVQDATLKLLAYCESRRWAGVDPYDALNSRLFQALPILDRRIPRLILTQALKRNIFDIRSVLMVPGAQNPKALGLFLMSLLKLSKLGLVRGKDSVAEMVSSLEALRSSDSKYWCWGYSFPWQTRTLLVPRWAPNLVCTTFIANALLDAYEQTGESRLLEMASSGARFILNELYWTEGDSVAGFAYPLPSMRNNVHNGNLLGAALFCRVTRHTGEKMFIEPALKVARYSASRQHGDGSWKYGEAPNQGWIDNFHTGYNLDALRTIGNALETDEFEQRVRHGFEFYRAHFLREDGAARYFHDRTYPIDIHCVAQSIITLVNFRDLDPENIQLANSVLNWAMNHMWDEKGFFYYRVLRSCTIRTSYMRWSQAWMLLAMSTLLCESSVEDTPGKAEDTAAALR
jgi:hypothetical protein